MNLVDAEMLAREEIATHLDSEWTFRWDRAKTRFGACDHRKKTIQLSSYLTKTNSESEVRDTILHEIAHALAGPQSGHNRYWKKIATSIGATPRAHSKVGKGMVPKYECWCPTCGTLVVFAFRKGHRMRGKQRHTDCGKQVVWLNAEGVPRKTTDIGLPMPEKIRRKINLTND